jgi:hypothetical protein
VRIKPRGEEYKQKSRSEPREPSGDAMPACKYRLGEYTAAESPSQVEDKLFR